MSDEPTDVLIAGYITKEPALVDYKAVIDADVEIFGMVAVSRDLEGNTSVEETDHIAKRGAEAGGGAGLVLGLVAPPLMAATGAAGAAVGGAVGGVAHSKVKSKIEGEMAKTIPWGGAGLIVAYPRSSGEAVGAAVSRPIKKAVGEAEGKRVAALQGALADAKDKLAAPADQPAKE
jgi:hypothetical protein